MKHYAAALATTRLFFLIISASALAQEAKPPCSDEKIYRNLEPADMSGPACIALLDYALKGKGEMNCIPIWVRYCNKGIPSPCLLTREILKQEKSWVPDGLTCLKQ